MGGEAKTLQKAHSFGEKIHLCETAKASFLTLSRPENLQWAVTEQQNTAKSLLTPYTFSSTFKTLPGEPMQLDILTAVALEAVA